MEGDGFRLKIDGDEMDESDEMEGNRLGRATKDEWRQDKR